MKQHVLVTGGAGYLGSVMVPELLNAGHKVTVLDNFMYGQNSLAHVCHYPDFNVVRGDIRVESTVAELMRSADVIIPLGALVGAPLCAKDPVGATTTNRDAILMMLGHASRDQAILMPTTNSAYGTGDENNFCTEESALRPISQYAIEKVEVERHLMDHPRAVSFRLATVFGMSPRMRTIDNLERMKGDIYNVGLSDANVSKRELCQAIQKHVPDFVFLEAPIGKDPDQRNYIVSNAKIEAMGFKPTHTLDFGIRELIKGYTMIRDSKYANV
jgi:nucleoside-diphosphate-sugar epimerase